MSKKLRTIFMLSVLALVMLFPMGAKAMTFVPPEELTYKPVVFSQITPNTTKVKVYAFENTRLYVKVGNKVLFQRKYTTTGTKTVTIKRQKNGTKLKFYLVNLENNKRGKVVYKKVTTNPKKVPLTKPKLEYSNGEVNVKGKIGCDVYVKTVGAKNGIKSWKKYTTLINKSGSFRLYNLEPSKKNGHVYVYVKLRDIDGKYSQPARVEVDLNEMVFEDSYTFDAAS